jgi:hypothetical protein
MSIPNTIKCPEMRLLSARDGEPPVFLGPGTIEIRNSTDFGFMMFATPVDEKSALGLLVRARDNPYEIQDQFRLVATDYQGTEWSCGWTLPCLEGLPQVGWPLTGRLQSLVTHASSSWVSKESGVELVFNPTLRLPMAEPMVSVTSIADEQIERRISAGRQTFTILDSRLEVSYSPFEESLWIIATTSAELRHPFLENWLSEPFRIMMGQLIFPRLVARNFGDGTAQVWLRPSYRQNRNARIASLMMGKSSWEASDFWVLYGRILTLIAKSVDADGHPNFEAHAVTR